MFCISFTEKKGKKEKKILLFYIWRRHRRNNVKIQFSNLRKETKKKTNQKNPQPNRKKFHFSVMKFFPQIEIKALQKMIIFWHLTRQNNTSETQPTSKEKRDRSVFPNRAVLQLLIGHRWGANASKHNNSSIIQTWQKGQGWSQITQPQVRKKYTMQTFFKKVLYIFSVHYVGNAKGRCCGRTWWFRELT